MSAGMVQPKRGEQQKKLASLADVARRAQAARGQRATTPAE
jgi:hypothetical protein